MTITAFWLAQRYIGIRELADKGHDHPLIQWWHSLCGFSLETPDSVPWCSSFANGIAWELRLPRSKSAMARSWLRVGTPVQIVDASPENDVVILKRGSGEQPDATHLDAPGHVGFFAGWDGGNVLVLGGNQQDGVCIEAFDVSRILGIRRLA